VLAPARADRAPAGSDGEALASAMQAESR